MEVTGHTIPPRGKFLGYIQTPIKACLQQACCYEAVDSTQSLSPLCRHSGKRKRPLSLVAFCNSLILMVPEAGIEPARRERRGILNPLCLPISPLGHRNRYQARMACLSIWRHVPESNRTKRICNPLHNRFANAPCKRELALYCLNLERETRLELATPTLARSCSTN